METRCSRNVSIDDIVQLLTSGTHTSSSTPSEQETDSELNSTYSGSPTSGTSVVSEESSTTVADISSDRKFFYHSVQKHINKANRISPRTAYVRAQYRPKRVMKIRRRLRLNHGIDGKVNGVSASSKGSKATTLAQLHSVVEESALVDCVTAAEHCPLSTNSVDVGVKASADEGICDVSNGCLESVTVMSEDTASRDSSGESGVSSIGDASTTPTAAATRRCNSQDVEEKVKDAWQNLLNGRGAHSDGDRKRKRRDIISLRSDSDSNKKTTNDKKEQTSLDVGQKKFGAAQCNVCSMVYSQCEPEDEIQHKKFHNHFMVATKFQGWRKEHVVATYLDARIIEVRPDDASYAHKKVRDLLAAVDADLGYIQDVGIKTNRKVYLYISDSKQIMGCCVAEHISHAYRIICDEQQQQESAPPRRQQLNIDDAAHYTDLCHTAATSSSYSADEVDVCCGINRIWTLKSQRRMGVATRLLDAVRHEFIPNHTVERDALAFSDPTPSGKVFAMKYSKRPDFLVYAYRQQ